MEDRVVFLEEILEQTFIEAYNVARINCSDDDAAVKIGMGIDGILSITDEYGQRNINVLKGYKSFFVRLVHADIYAMVLSDAIVLDDTVCSEFRERIESGNYEDMLTSYFVDLLRHYIKVLHVKADIELTEDNLRLVREICPWYKLGGRKC